VTATPVPPTPPRSATKSRDGNVTLASKRALSLGRSMNGSDARRLLVAWETVGRNGGLEHIVGCFHRGAAHHVALWSGAAHQLTDRYGIPPRRITVIPNATGSAALATGQNRGPEDARETIGITDDGSVPGVRGGVVRREARRGRIGRGRDAHGSAGAHRRGRTRTHTPGGSRHHEGTGSGPLPRFGREGLRRLPPTTRQYG
jgi:hypothetical protein